MDTSSSITEVVQQLNIHIGEDVAHVFEEAELDGKSFMALKREDVLELLPGPRHFLARKKIMNLVEACKTGNAGEAVALATPPKGERPKPAVISISTLPTSPSGMPSAMPEFPIYIADGQKTDRNQLIRITIGNMRTITHNLDPPREPIPLELDQMARRLVAKYPKLSDDEELNPTRPWDGLFMNLKRRLGNVKPVQNPQGRTPNRGKKRKHPDDPLNQPEENRAVKADEVIGKTGETDKLTDKPADSKNAKPDVKIPENPKGKYEGENNENSDKPLKKIEKNRNVRLNEKVQKCDELISGSEESEEEMGYEGKEMAKHYEKLCEHMKRSKSNPKVITQLMDLEYKSRRAWIRNVKIESVSAKIARVSNAYSCFSYPSPPTELLEEIRRMVVNTGCNPRFELEEAKQRLESSWDRMWSYGLASGKLDPVNGSSKDSKVTAILTGLNSIFPGGKNKNRQIASIMNEKKNFDKTIKETESPALIIGMKHLLVAGGQKLLVKLDKSRKDCWEVALLSLMGAFYAFDLGYPAGLENVLLILQATVLEDKVHPEDATKRYNLLMAEYSKY